MLGSTSAARTPRLPRALACARRAAGALVLALACAAGVARAGATPADSLALARSWMARSDYARAEPVARRALARLEARAHVPADSLGGALDVLVESLWRQGFATRAETRALAERALALRDTSAGTLDSAAAGALLSLGAIRAQTADFEGARVLLDRALAIRTRWPGRDSLELAWAVNERAALALRRGELAEARDGMRRVLALREHALGPAHPLVAWSCSNLASALETIGDLVGARRLRERCVAIQRRSLGADDPDRARGLKDLANTLVALGDLPRARSLYELSLRARIRALGPRHPDVANGLANLAALELQLGRLVEARRDARRALAIREQAYDPDNPEIATSLLQVGRILAESGEPAAAADSMRRALAIRERVFGRAHPVTALALEGLAGALLASGRPDSAEALERRALTAQYEGLGAGHPDLARGHAMLAEAEMAEGRWNFALEDAGECEKIAGEHLATTIPQLSEREALQYEEARRSGLDLMVRIASRPAASAREQRHTLDCLISARGRVLGAIGARLRNEPYLDAGLGEVIEHLPAGSALVSYVRCAAERFPVRRPAIYVAFVTYPGADPRVRTVVLGPARAIDARVARWRAEVLAPAASRDSLVRAGEALRRAVWDPLQGALGDAGRVIVVADGALHAVNLYALPDGHGRWLVEGARTIELVSAERSLVRERAGGGGDRLLALGGIRYAAAAPGAGAPLPPLPRSGREVDEIASLWRGLASTGGDAIVLRGGEATAAALRAHLAGCEVLHVATHGVFAGGDPLRDADGSDGTSMQGVFAGSGLVLAPEIGAQQGDLDRTGFLSVADVARLDLHGARWVVLSGCETGAGRALAREGALGLRSAFELAGARVVIMSLWPVEDRWAESWMRALYRARFARGLPTREAVRAAAREVLALRRRFGLDDGPAAWAGFVACGLDD